MIDPGGEESAAHLSELLTFYGFERVQRACWESTTLSEKQLVALKREIDRVTDYYDVIRMYQYPVRGMFSITELHRKKWRRCVLKADDAENEGGINPSKENF